MTTPRLHHISTRQFESFPIEQYPRHYITRVIAPRAYFIPREYMNTRDNSIFIRSYTITRDFPLLLHYHYSLNTSPTDTYSTRNTYATYYPLDTYVTTTPDSTNNAQTPYYLRDADSTTTPRNT
eukprot:GHVS01082023.1.p2 GENE.GHVS01082023.1~~GHVS01082023.1.p2  ORF type:complete len:124 (+),score=4.79 GHVS01082023.1:381-752(+)